MTDDVAKLKMKWGADCAKHLVGKTIAKARYMSTQEVEDHGWFNSALVIEFTDGNFIYSSSDDEGNDAGALFTSFENLPTIPVI